MPRESSSFLQEIVCSCRSKFFPSRDDLQFNGGAKKCRVAPPGSAIPSEEYSICMADSIMEFYSNCRMQ